MRKLYLGNGDKQFKFADTTTEIHLNALDNGSAAALTADAKIRIKNESGYLLDVNASIDNNHAVITSGQLDKLPTGSYLIELWDTVDGGTAIYPSDGFLALQINENVTGLSGGLVSSITVEDFVQQFSDLSEQLKQQVSDAVSDGLKGEKGDDGLSAYQIAVINGYQGSQTEWLASLVGAKGDKGEKGNPGKDFKIVKTFPSIVAMNGDGFSDGDFTMIASDVNDPDDGKLYVWNGTGFTYVADLSGSQGIKGEKGDNGEKGDPGEQGEQGLSAYQISVNAGFSGSVDQWLTSLVGPKGDKGDTGDTGPIGPVGAGLTVKGSVNDASQLPTTGNQEGYCYFVGTDLYIWDAGEWKNYGSVIPNLSNYTTATDLNNGLSTKVTDNKNGSISVNGTSIIPANENVIDRIDGTYTDMNDIPMGWMYLNGWADVSKLANWGLPKAFYYVHCFKTDFSMPTTIQIAYGTETNNTYVRTMSINTWTTWKLLSDDSKVAHLSGANNFDTVPTYGTGNKPFAINDTGATTARPTGQAAGYQYFDTSLNKPIWYTGKNWVDATGTTV